MMGGALGPHLLVLLVPITMSAPHNPGDGHSPLTAVDSEAKQKGGVCVGVHLFGSDESSLSSVMECAKNIPSPKLYARLDSQSSNLAAERLAVGAFQNADVTVTDNNKGADVYSKLIAIDKMIADKASCEYTVFLHSKSDLDWREHLLGICSSPQRVEEAMSLLREDGVGMVGGPATDCLSRMLEVAEREDWANKGDRGSIWHKCKDTMNKNIHQMARLTDRLNLTRIPDMDMLQDNFIAGNMFWVKTNILIQALEGHDLKQLAEDMAPHTRQDDGTIATAMERLFAWMVLMNGKQVRFMAGDVHTRYSAVQSVVKHKEEGGMDLWDEHFNRLVV